MTPGGLLAASYVDDATGKLTFFAVDPETGALETTWAHCEPVGLRALARHPSLPVVYALGGSKSGAVVALAVSKQSVEVIGRTSSGGTFPCAAAVDPSGSHLVTVNYGSGELVVFSLGIDGAVGSLSTAIRQDGSGPDPERQEASHPHQVVFTAGGRKLIVVDLGADAFFVYHFDQATGELALPPDGRCPAHPGSGPRHLAFIDNTLVAVSDELSDSVSVYAFSELHGIVSGGVTAPASADGRAGVRNYPADVAIVPGGRILVTNRGNNTVSLFGVEDGAPTLIEEAQVGAWPQHLAVVGSRVYCAAQEGNEIGLFEIDRRSAGLGTQRPVVEAASPSWLLDASWLT